MHERKIFATKIQVSLLSAMPLSGDSSMTAIAIALNLNLERQVSTCELMSVDGLYDRAAMHPSTYPALVVRLLGEAVTDRHETSREPSMSAPHSNGVTCVM